MIRLVSIVVILGAIPPTLAADAPAAVGKTSASVAAAQVINLPAPDKTGGMALNLALASRRSMREFSDAPLTLAQLSQLLWAAQGVTEASGRRTAPSAGAKYPLELYAVVKDGVYHYEPREHRLVRTAEGDLHQALAAAALSQQSVASAPAVFVFAAVLARTEVKYGPERTPRYVAMEAGHAAQNLLLEATALGLVAVPAGAFNNAAVARALSLPAAEAPLYLVPVGRPR